MGYRMDIIEKLTEYIVTTRYEDIPPEVIEIEKRSLLDVLGCLVAGATAPGCSAVLDLVREEGGKKESTIMMHGDKVPAQNAALVNATMARALDFEPCGAAASHANAPAVATAFAISERIGGIRGKDCLTALTLGVDLTARIYSSWKTGKHGWDPALVCSIFGATAVAGRILGLSHSQMRNAFGIALNQASGTWQSNYDGALMVRLNTGLAARGGIFSALLTQRGITGVKQVMQGRWGFYNLYANDEYDLDLLIAGLGERFLNVETRFKMYPACIGTFTVTEATIELTRKYNITPDDVGEIIIGVTKGQGDRFCGRPFELGENPQVYAQFSNQYAAANALLRRSSLKEHFTDEFITDPRVQELVGKVRQVELFQPLKEVGAMPRVRVEIKMKNGKSYSVELSIPKGIPPRSLSKEEILDKFRNNVTYSAKTPKVLPQQRGEEIITLVDHLEELSDVNQIVRAVAVAD